MLNERSKSLEMPQTSFREGSLGLLDRGIHNILRYKEPIDRFWRTSLVTGVTTLYIGITLDNLDVSLGGAAVGILGLGLGLATQAAMRRYLRNYYK